MLQGVIYKAFGGYYFIDTGENRYRCSLRGKLSKKEKVLVGDRVRIMPLEKDSGVVESVEERRTRLIRPPVANVDIAVMVFSMDRPSPNYYLLDRILVQAEYAEIVPVVCFNKCDLVESEDEIKNVTSIYEKAGYRVIPCSAAKGRGTGDLNEVFKDSISVLAGPSGAGKSSLLNAVQPEFSLEVGEISEKLEKGKHTTRRVELLKLEHGGWVADTPGFSNINLPAGMKAGDLPGYFPEFLEYEHLCRFKGCLHYKEPGCAVKESFEEGLISSSRYKNYVSLLEEILNQERR